MIKNFLPTGFYLILILLISILALVLGSIGFVFGIIVLITIAKIFQIKKIPRNNNLGSSKEIILSPTTGRVKTIRYGLKDNESQKLTQLHFTKVPFLDPGIYFPCTGELIDIQETRSESPGIPKYLNLTFKNPSGLLISLKVYKNLLNFTPTIIPKIGDKGRNGACLGFMPLGGHIYLEVPSEFNIDTAPKKVTMAQTIIAQRLKT